MPWQLDRSVQHEQWVCLTDLHRTLRAYVVHAERIATCMPFADDNNTVERSETTFDDADPVRARIVVLSPGWHERRLTGVS